MFGLSTDVTHNWLRRCRGLMPAGYSLAFAVLTDGSAFLVTGAAMLQRSHLGLLLCAAVMLAATAPAILTFVCGFECRPVTSWLAWWSVAALLLWASPAVAADLAPLILVVMMGRVGSLAGPLYGVLTCTSAVALLITASALHRLGGIALYVSVVLLGWMVGYLMRVQAQLLVKQWAAQAELAEHAVADERRRIAGEVHDVIAHALSGTVLHVTGARRILEKSGDVTDAIGALADAERLGRQAMFDIRHTIGLLDVGTQSVVAEPGIEDLDELVDSFAQAGLRVTWRMDGPGERISAAVALAVYRITQESLSNVAKHAPDAEVTAHLAVTRSAALLSVSNDLPSSLRSTPSPSLGRGLRGMRYRVKTLGGMIVTGPTDGKWLVRAELPLCDDAMIDSQRV